jgi:hypothetical protein
MSNKFLFSVLVFALLIVVNPVFAQRDLGARPTGSGGVLMSEQAAYDVKSYDLAVRVNPQEQSIKGVLTVTALIVKPINKFVLDLDIPFTIESVDLVFPLSDKANEPLKFERREGRIWISLPTMEKAGKTIDVRVAYSGKPRVRRGLAVLSGRKRRTARPGLQPPCRTTAQICGFPSKTILPTNLKRRRCILPFPNRSLRLQTANCNQSSKMRTERAHTIGLFRSRLAITVSRSTSRRIN